MTSIPKSLILQALPWLYCAAFFANSLILTSTALCAEEDDEDKEKDDVETIEEILADCDTLKGLFPIHQNRDDGKLLLEIHDDQISSRESPREFIHFSHTLDGVPELGLFRGQFSRAKVFSLTRHYDKIEFVVQNTNFYFNPASALRKASDANISDAVLASAEIVASDEEAGRHLVEADGIFLKEFFRQLKPGKKKDEKGDRFKLGDLSKDRTRFLEAKNFPDNTLVRVQYVFENLHPSEYGEEDVADSRFVTVKVQHTFIEMPENDYEPRFADPRVGYFTTQITDLTSKSSAPYRDFVHRWDLRKKDPDASLSDPVDPIVWWIENTTPHELRDTIRDGVLAWNKAFESAGISNAIEVKIQPDDADWDADDIRYHVLRWTSSPDPPFGGYGPSFVNPRTGQILGADIMLEYIFMTNRIRFSEIVDLGRASPAVTSMSDQLNQGGHFCQCRHHLHSSRIAGQTMLRARLLSAPGTSHFDNGEIEMKRLLTEALTDLTLHEIGHTLGLNHNFRSSYLHNRETINDHNLTARTGTISSVMDYAPINLARNPENQGHYFSVVPGPYDHWAIRFGYGAASQRETILNESIKPEHVFANDADDMRSAGRGIDPRAMINDLTNEPILYASDQIAMVRETLPKLETIFPVEGTSHHEMRTAFSTLMSMHERAAEVMSRFPGGVYVDRSMVGQEGASENPFTPVPAEKQQLAMKHLAADVFAPDAFAFSPSLIAKLQLERRGFDFFELKTNEDPKVHERVASIHSDVLTQLLHKNTLSRFLDTSLYGNNYPIDTFLDELTTAIMKGDPEEGVNSFREALQIDYVERLIKITGLEEPSSYPPAAKSEAMYQLMKLLPSLEVPSRPARHNHFLARRIEKAFESR